MESIPPDKMAKMLARKKEQDAIAAANVAYMKQQMAAGVPISVINRAMKQRTKVRKFWEKVERGGPDECWPWLGKDHGLVMHAGSRQRVARRAWEFEHGPVPEGKCIRPTCGTRNCCNPAHAVASPKGRLKKKQKKGPPTYRPREET